jgi:hypothetical protein
MVSEMPPSKKNDGTSKEKHRTIERMYRTIKNVRELCRRLGRPTEHEREAAVLTRKIENKNTWNLYLRPGTPDEGKAAERALKHLEAALKRLEQRLEAALKPLGVDTTAEGPAPTPEESAATASRKRQAERAARKSDWNILQDVLSSLRKNAVKMEKTPIDRVTKAVETQSEKLGGYIRQLARLVRLAYLCEGVTYETFFNSGAPRTPDFFEDRIRKALVDARIPTNVAKLGYETKTIVIYGKEQIKEEIFIEFTESEMHATVKNTVQRIPFRLSWVNIPPLAILVQIITEAMGYEIVSAFFKPLSGDRPTKTADEVARALHSAFSAWLSEAFANSYVARQAVAIETFLMKCSNRFNDDIIFNFWITHAEADKSEGIVDSESAGEKPESSPASVGAQHAFPPLSRAKREKICESLRKSHKAIGAKAGAKITKGAKLPEGIESGPLHAELVARVPELAGYHAALFGKKHMVFIEPTSRTVLGQATIPEGLGFTRFSGAAQALLRFRRAAQLAGTTKQVGVNYASSLHDGKWDPFGEDDEKDESSDEWRSPIVDLCGDPCGKVKWLDVKHIEQLRHYLYGCTGALKKEPTELSEDSDNLSIPETGTSNRIAILRIYFKLADVEEGEFALMGRDRFDVDSFTETLLRADVFSYAQNMITQFLRDSESGLLDAEDIVAALPHGFSNEYEQVKKDYDEIRQHVHKMMLASILHFAELEIPQSEQEAEEAEQEANEALETLLRKVAEPTVLKYFTEEQPAPRPKSMLVVVGKPPRPVSRIRLKRAYKEATNNKDVDDFIAWVKGAANQRRGFAIDDRKKEEVQRAYVIAAPVLVRLARDLDKLADRLQAYLQKHPLNFEEDRKKFEGAFRKIYVDVEDVD